MMQYVSLSPPLTIFVDFCAWLFLHFLVGWIAWRMPVSIFMKDNWLYRSRGWEQGGQFYRRFLFIDRWKRFMPEAGDFFPGGFSKKRLLHRDPEYLKRFYIETRRGEFTHWLSMMPAPLFFLWNSWPVGLCMIGYALAFNLPFIAINRFNRARLTRGVMRGSSQPSGRHSSLRVETQQGGELARRLKVDEDTIPKIGGKAKWETV
jgi:glycosyl-4,4'-diaponeurosporenoate acyltransferase